MKHVVVGTAGHVDHGKTSLVLALTGTDCDRLPEEKARGITIELGFAAWSLPRGLRASVIDVPGHERFVRTMVAGATGIDVALLCVAADDGVMPQTREHLDVCALLGIQRGVVAITKSDLGDEETLALVEEDVRAAVRGTFLEGAPVVCVSVRDGRGLDALAEAVARAAEACAPRAASGPAFVGIDRVFSKAGAGTVVTGTLARGALAVGDSVDVMPTARGDVARAKVRGLHVHGETVERVVAPSRVAVNLRGEGDVPAERGAAVVSADGQRPTRIVLAEIALLASSAGLPRRASVVVHVGTAQRPAFATLVAADALDPGGRALARIAVRAPIAAFAGQRFVLRRAERGRDRTIGGGVILDPHPRVTRGRAPGAHGSAGALVLEARYAGISIDELARRLPPEVDAAAEAHALVVAGAALEEGHALYPASLLAEAQRDVLAHARALHAEQPHAEGAATAEIATRVPPRLRALVPAAVAALVASGALVRSGARVRDRAQGAGGGEAFAELAAIYARAGLAPPLDEEARAAARLEPRAFKDALVDLKRRGVLRALTGGLHFSAAALDDLRGRVEEHFARAETLAPIELKAMCGGLSRKFAIPILEWLDTQGTTRRRGDVRVAGSAIKRRA